MAFVGEEQRGTLSALAGVSAGGWGGSEVSFNWKGYIVDPLSRVWIDLPALWNPMVSSPIWTAEWITTPGRTLEP